MSPGDWFPSLRMCVFKNRRTTVNTRKDQNTRNLPEGRKEGRKKGMMACISIVLRLEQRFLLYFSELYG